MGVQKYRLDRYRKNLTTIIIGVNMGRKYCTRFPISEFRKRIKNEKSTFSIVYRFYSTKRGRCVYVGRTNNPYTRISEYLNNAKNRCERIGARVSYVSYRKFKGKSRKNSSYDEECIQYHRMNKEYRNARKHPGRDGKSKRKCPINQKKCPQ
tara:strand:- start:93 stop:548 length:456 start_codon:yes stop_codon:yes gene_type:complete